ncbi:MAG: YbaN family protein [Parvibaculum sp.]|uniref:YbaN family protein n=1 Tax=Parvibaculum sp. TaxID=2024848 RepID=UPI003C77E582
MRVVWQAAGLLCVGLALLGVALPLLPTAPFVLLAAFCFARSSPSLHDRLLSNRVFGEIIRDWHMDRAISRKGKVVSVFAMASSLAISLALAVDLAIVGLQALVLCGISVFILTRNTPPWDLGLSILRGPWLRDVRVM